MLGQSDVPADVQVRPVNAAGVPSLVLTARPDQPATLLYLHGGAYISGSAFGFRPLAGAIAAATGATVLVPEYRLAPEYPFPAALHDATRAYQWMLDQGTDPDQVIICGDSSGVGLAMSLLLDAREQDEPMPAGVALLCPLVDLTGRSLANRAPDATQPMMTAEMLAYVAGQYLAGHPINDPLVAPLEADLTGLPPLLVQTGTGDPLLDDARRLVEHAQRHGVEVSLELYPVDTHGFHLFWSFLPEAADAIQKLSAFSKGSTPRARTAPIGGLGTSA
jgi:acetyl esterase/lipase